MTSVNIKSNVIPHAGFTALDKLQQIAFSCFAWVLEFCANKADASIMKDRGSVGKWEEKVNLPEWPPLPLTNKALNQLNICQRFLW